MEATAENHNWTKMWWSAQPQKLHAQQILHFKSQGMSLERGWKDCKRQRTVKWLRLCLLEIGALTRPEGIKDLAGFNA